MNLITKIKDLQAHCAQEPGYFAVLEELLSALGQFHEGDAERIRTVLLALRTQPAIWGSCIAVLERMQAACEMMEKESKP